MSAFGVVGAVCFCVDVGLFQLLYGTVGVNPLMAKFCSTIVSVTLAYLGHRYWSFSNRARPGVRQEYLVFAAVNAVTLLLALGLIAVVRYQLGQHHSVVLQLTNIASIAAGTVIRYLSYRAWVFPARSVEEPAGV
jgi:putative flippase GtrA